MTDCISQGYKVKRIDGECCPVCDYNISDDSCGVIKLKTQSLKVVMDSDDCIAEVLIHSCDKKVARVNGRLRRCKATRGNKQVDLQSHSNPRCRNIKTVVYRDVMDCTVQHIPKFTDMHIFN
jgi:hypothetical protein